MDIARARCIDVVGQMDGRPKGSGTSNRLLDLSPCVSSWLLSGLVEEETINCTEYISVLQLYSVKPLTALRANTAFHTGKGSVLVRECYLNALQMLFRRWSVFAQQWGSPSLVEKAWKALQLVGGGDDLPIPREKPLSDLNSIAIFGNSGVGKSTMLRIVLAICVSLELPVRIAIGDDSKYYFRRRLGLENVDSRAWIHLVDHYPPEPPLYGTWLFVSSPAVETRLRRWLDFYPRYFVMPHWSEEEIKSACTHCFEDVTFEDDVLPIYTLVGGSARACLAPFKDSDRDMPSYLGEITDRIERAISSIESPERLKELIADVDKKDGRHISHLVVRKVLTQDRTQTSVLMHQYKTTKEFVSETVSQKVTTRLRDLLHSHRGTLFQVLRDIPQGASLRGNLYEPAARLAIEAGLRYAKTRLLCSTGKNPRPPAKMHLEAGLSRISFRNLEDFKLTDIPCVTDSRFHWVFEISNFPSVESYRPSPVSGYDLDGYQMTVSLDHPVSRGGIFGMKEAYFKKLSEKEKRNKKLKEPENVRLRLIFVVPPEIYLTFPKQNWKQGGTVKDDIGVVDQFCMEIDVDKVSDKTAIPLWSTVLDRREAQQGQSGRPGYSASTAASLEEVNFEEGSTDVSQHVDRVLADPLEQLSLSEQRGVKEYRNRE
eukprot:gb/GECG01006080.1/.p1 GENE.gb/GECG01006080.1/~~gb/GECG01006080.1/.p1  ORF type:complete len:656 (+),score=66.77 gb/GECG01006080.1/:1-1968(+)